MWKVVNKTKAVGPNGEFQYGGMKGLRHKQKIIDWCLLNEVSVKGKTLEEWKKSILLCP